MFKLVKEAGLLVGLLAFSLSIPSPAAAAEAQDGGTSGQAEMRATLESVKVTAGRVEQELQDVPVSVSVITSEDIERSPKTAVQDYLRDVPGVHVSQSYYGKYTFSIRGYDKDRVVLLIDGVRQNSASTLLSEERGGIEVDPSNIKRIEVIKGPASALYGSDAVGGVINIITKKGGKKPLSTNITLGYDTSIEAFTPKFSLDGNEENGLSYRVGASRVKAHDRRLPDNEKFKYSDYEKENYNGNIGYAWDSGRALFSAEHYTGSSRTPQTSADGRKQEYRYGRNYTGMPTDKRTTLNGNLTLDNLTENLNQINTRLFMQKLEVKIDGLGDADPNDITSPSCKGTDEDISFGGSFQTNWTFLDSHLLIAGVDFERSNMTSEADYLNGSYANNGILDEDRKGYSQSMAVFAQDEWSIFKDLALTVGLRYTNNIIELTDDKTFPNREDKDSDHSVVGNVGLVYRGIDNLALRALFSQGYRSPSLTAKFMGGTQRFMANPDLDPEKSNNYELGARYLNGGLSIDMAGFYSTLKDAFASIDTGIPHPAGRNYMQTRNVDEAKSFGTELAASWYIDSFGLTPYGSMTWMRYQHHHNTGLKTFDTGRPELWGTFGLKWEREFGKTALFYTDLSMTMSDGYKTQNANGTYTDTNTYDSGKQLNLALGIRGGEERKYNIALSLRNLLDDRYEPDGHFTPGFHAVISAGYTW